jgi:hypothetical protein
MRPQLRPALAAAALAALAGACADGATAPAAADEAFDLSAAFATLPQGYGSVPTSYAGAEAAGPWMRGDRGPGPGTAGLMGGGLGDAFAGGVPFGRGGHRGPFGGGLGCAGAFDAASGRVACPTATLPNGLTITRSAAYQTAAGQAQQAFDSATTDRVTLRTATSGTVTFDSASGRGRGGFGFGTRGGGRHGGRRGGPGGRGGLLLGDTATIVSATTTVENASDRTTTGLAAGSAQRTVNATSSSRESTTGASSRGRFTATRAAGDTTRGLVVPVAAAGAAAYPTAGTVVRSMRATLAYDGGTPSTSSRREVLTYDGTATARLVITEDGTTRTCTVALPRGRPACQ